MHQYPLHRISYCADDKVDKQFFSFIVKDSNESERHTCFVFMSDKLAEEITLSIGQAFDLAYKYVKIFFSRAIIDTFFFFLVFCLELYASKFNY